MSGQPSKANGFSMSMNKTRKFFIGSIVIIALLIAGYFILDHLLFDGIKPVPVSEHAFEGMLYTKKNLESRPAIIVLGGGDWGNFWAGEFAKKNYIGLSLPYYRQENLPPLPENIPLEYFENAMLWLKKQPGVHPAKIIVMGASRNAELALLLASYFPNHVHGVIAFSPSSVCWSNTVLPYNSDSLQPGWTFNGEPVPYISMEKIQGNQTSFLETLSYWKNGLSDSVAVNNAAIPVENIKGPILLLSGVNDEVWPSSFMSDMIATRLKNKQFKYEFENIQYENAGHQVSANPNNSNSSRQGSMEVNGKRYDFNLGGTPTGDATAQRDAAARIFRYLLSLDTD